MKEKKLKLITIILAIILVCLVSFVGVYTQQMNTMKNQVKDFSFSKDLEGYRELILDVSTATEVKDSNGNIVGNTDNFTDDAITSNSYEKTENKVNKDESLTTENYKKVKSILEKRLQLFKVDDYSVSLNEQEGKIYIQIPENQNTNNTISNLCQVGKFSVKDSEDKEKVFLTNSDLKKVSSIPSRGDNGITVFLQIKTNKNGKKVLKDLSNGEYATKPESEESSDSNQVENKEETTGENETENTTENNQEENTTEQTENSNQENNTDNSSEEKKSTQKKIILSIDNSDLITTSFNDPINNGIINLSMNAASTEQDSINETMRSTSTIAAILNSGELPLVYKVSESNYINTDISKDTLLKVIYVFIIVNAILLIYMVLKFKTKGIIGLFAYIGFIAIDLLLIRYTNVKISLESFVAGAIVLLINYCTVYKLLKINETDEEIKKNMFKKAFIDTIIRLIPILLVSIIFAFVTWAKLATFGMFMFWGIFVGIIYNYLVTKNMLD